jgi:hypothetical protein
MAPRRRLHTSRARSSPRTRRVQLCARTPNNRDIGLKVTPSFTRSATGRGGEVLVKIVIDASRLSFTINDYDRREGKLEVHVPVTVAPSFVKVVVLDYEANLTGSAMVKIK